MATWYKKEMGVEPEASRETGQITAALDRYISASEDPDGKGVLRHFDRDQKGNDLFYAGDGATRPGLRRGAVRAAGQ